MRIYTSKETSLNPSFSCALPSKQSKNAALKSDQETTTHTDIPNCSLMLEIMMSFFSFRIQNQHRTIDLTFHPKSPPLILFVASGYNHTYLHTLIQSSFKISVCFTPHPPKENPQNKSRTNVLNKRIKSL